MKVPDEFLVAQIVNALNQVRVAIVGAAWVVSFTLIGIAIFK